MAKVFKRGKFYYARFMAKGKDVCRSTGVKVMEKDAREKADEKLKQLLAEKRGQGSIQSLFDYLLTAIDALPEHVREQKRITLSEKLRQGAKANLAVNHAWQAWLDNPKKRNPDPDTIGMYQGIWGRDKVKKHGQKNKQGFKSWLAKNYEGIIYLHEVTPTIAEEYASYLWASGIAPRTFNGHIKFLQSFFRVLKTRAGLIQNVWDDIPTMEKETEGKRNFTPEELQKVCSQATGELRYWLAIGLYTGLRLGDVVTLKWSEVKLRKGMIERVPSKTRRKGKVVRFPIHPVLMAMLTELRETAKDRDGFLFPEAAGTYLKDHRKIVKQIQGHFEKCGIKTTENPTNGHRKMAIVRVGFHSLRHSFVSLCAANRVPQVAIQELVGHGSPAMTALYSHANDEQKAAAIAALPEYEFNNGKE